MPQMSRKSRLLTRPIHSPHHLWGVNDYELDNHWATSGCPVLGEIVKMNLGRFLKFPEWRMAGMFQVFDFPRFDDPVVQRLFRQAILYYCCLPLYLAALVVHFIVLRKSIRLAKIGLIVGFAYLGIMVIVFLLSGILADPNLAVVAGLMAIVGIPLCLVTIVGGWIRLQFAYRHPSPPPRSD